VTGQFELTHEQRALRERTAVLAAERLAPLARHDGSVNREMLETLAAEGLLGQVFPGRKGEEEARAAPLDLCLIREGLAQGCTEAETTLALQGLGAYPILLHGDEETRSRWIPEVAAGRAVAGFALTEPAAGSDAAALQLKAVPDGDGWLLSGTKIWISNAPEADVYTVFARTGGAGAGGVSAFVVPADSPGMDGESIAMLSPHAIGRLEFTMSRSGPGRSWAWHRRLLT
jgi:alkylation response protein AidB-like acyl-CoA dehydrogenase